MRHFPHLGISETPLLRKMGDDANDELGFQVQGSTEAMLNCPSSGAGMNTDSLSEKVAAMSSGGGGGPSFYGSGGGWDPIASMSSQAENFGAASSMVSRADFASSSYPLMLESQRIDDATSHLVHYPSDPSFSGMVPRLPIYGSGNYSEMVSSFGLRGCAQASNAPQSYNPTRSATIEKVSLDASLGQGNGKISVERAVSGVSLNGKRTMGSSDSPPLASNKDLEADRHRENTVEASEPKEPEEKKQKTEQTPGGNSGAKQTGKQAEDGSQSGEDRKQNYIHVRARRGQATNSHSLAERVRREKISERMRLLQELVPGCNKITGKAVMLDEIINYVQSLQQQVEFLSMKLATVNPELGFDIDRILSKDILNSRGGGSSLLGCNLGMISSHPFTPAIHPGSLTTLQNASSQQYHPVPPQAMWDNDLHNLLQMGFDSNTPAASNLGPNGSSKMEL